MEVLSKTTLDLFPLIPSSESTGTYASIPIIDLSAPNSNVLVTACKEFGFFKVINHGVSMELMSKLKAEAMKFFSLTQCEKDRVGPPNPSGYGTMKVGNIGDVSWIEYLLMTCKPDQFVKDKMSICFKENHEDFGSTLKDYISAVRKLTCEVLELLAEGLGVEPKNFFSKLLMDEKSYSLFRINHYPACPELQNLNGLDLIGFGEHTDPQIISVQSANDVGGLQILLRDGNWVSVPPDHNSFFFNVGDSLQVMTNGRFKSVKHRVLVDSFKSRLSVIYFGGPPLSQAISPLRAIMEEGEEGFYKEFTWEDYLKAAKMTKLSDNRLSFFKL